MDHCSDNSQCCNEHGMASDGSPLFIEIRPPCNAPPRGPDRIEVLICSVDPQNCGPLLKDLSRIVPKDETISHLKRVKRLNWPQQQCKQEQPSDLVDSTDTSTVTTSTIIVSDSSSSQSPPTKKAKLNLQVLLGRRKASGSSTSYCCDDEAINSLVQTYNLELQTALVPGRSAESTRELQEFNAIWPTIYFQKNTEEHKEQQEHNNQLLSEATVRLMIRGMELAIEDGGATVGVVGGDGAVIMDPVSGRVVSTSLDERTLLLSSSVSFLKQREKQDHYHDQPRVTSTNTNPLNTSVLLALQGVSRLERMAALGFGMESEEFKRGQYLCTGYDIYLTKEPSVFEAMALVHSRIRQVVFGVPNTQDGGLGGTGDSSAVNLLPATNHRYRVFMCAPGSVLSTLCKAPTDL
ncbi:RNA modification [Fragilaria crotonensis]|nr:RNA modification [Fragilaria crotonensis]